MLHSPQLHREVLALNNHRPEVDRVLTTWRTPGYQLASFSQSPRHFKTHLPFTLLPPSLLDRCKAKGEVIVQFRAEIRKTFPPDFMPDFSKVKKVAMAGTALRDPLPEQQPLAQVLRFLV
ncbi:hypothetical protein J6590_105674 [Homalodisca vitripennis]|nr:hypothetical protein J6590_105674 [Homalodisca vitripennis]